MANYLSPYYISKVNGDKNYNYVDDFYINNDIQNLKSVFEVIGKDAKEAITEAINNYDSSNWFYWTLYYAQVYSILVKYPQSNINTIKAFINGDINGSIECFNNACILIFGEGQYSFTIGVGEINLEIKAQANINILYSTTDGATGNIVMQEAGATEEEGLIGRYGTDFYEGSNNQNLLYNFVPVGVKLNMTIV